MMTKYPMVEDPRLDAVASALANDRRRAAISRLCRGPATTTELAAHTGAALPTMHQHLQVLRDAGLVHSVKHGRTVTHTIDLDPLLVIEQWTASRRSFWTDQPQSLSHAMEEQK